MPKPNNVTPASDRPNVDLAQSPIFDAQWYRAAYGDVDPRIDPAQHFRDVGAAQGRNPNAFMDGAWYAARYLDVRAVGGDPLRHYLECGWREGRDPGPWFSNTRYLAANPDVRAAGIDPLRHFLQTGAAEGRMPHGLSPVDLRAVEMLIRGKDRGSAMVCQWAGELALHGVAVRTTIVDAWPLPDLVTRIALGMLAAWRSKRSRTPLISVNGAALTPAIARKTGRHLIAIFDDATPARSVRPELRDALSRATVATMSPGIATVLAGILGAGVSCHAEAMASAYLQDGSQQRTISVVWRCPSPRASRGKPRGQVRERLAIAQRLAPHGLVIVGDSGWRAQRGILAELDLRRDWASQSCARSCYAMARLSIITPPRQRDGEVTADVLIALASATLPIVPFSMAANLFARFGEDCPIALFRDGDELAAIVAHYLQHEDERAALVEKGRRYLFGEPGYSAWVGEILGKVVDTDR